VELRSEAYLIRSDDEAILVAQRLAAEFALEASERDQKRRLPYQELERSSRRQDPGKLIEVKPLLITQEELNKNDIKTVSDLDSKLPGFGSSDQGAAA
jgi:hypothetical protein